MAGRAAVAALAGAGGAAAYVNKDSYPAQLLRQIWDSPNWQHAQPAVHNAELDRISRMVEHLSRDMGRQQSVTILRTDRTGSNVLLVAVGAAGVGYLYLRFWCGISLGDLMYVTRASLKQSSEAFAARLDQFKNAVHSQMTGITSRQKESMEKQNAMGDQLDQLGSDVDSLGSNVGEVNEAVQDLRGKWDQMRITQEDALLGIHALCGSVQDLMCRANVKSQAASKLDAYMRRPRSSLLVSPQGSAGFAAALGDDSPASNGRLLGEGSEAPPRQGLGIFKRTMSLGAGAGHARQGQNSRLHRNNPQSINIFDLGPDGDDQDSP